MQDNFSITDVVVGIAGNIFTIFLGLFGFWTAFIKNLVTKQEVCQMIEVHSPYSQDRPLIMERLNDHKQTTATLFKALEKNTEVMMELKIQIATLGKTLENLESRIERGKNG